MATEARVRALRTKHHELESLIDSEERKTLPDDFVIHDLKKQKLRIKDELTDITQH